MMRGSAFTFIRQMNHLFLEIINREIVLQSFVSVVDAELFETVAVLERLEPVQIQYTC